VAPASVVAAEAVPPAWPRPPAQDAVVEVEAVPLA
jgi:hypothetical protein